MNKLIFFATTVFLAVTFTAQLGLATSLNMLYPLYNYPNWYADSYVWDDIAAVGNDINITAVINPANGPGDSNSPNADYNKGLTDLAEGACKLFCVTTCLTHMESVVPRTQS